MLKPLAVAILLCGCVTEVDHEPIVIDDALLTATFAACEVDIAECLDDPIVFEQIAEKVDAGDWMWPPPPADGEFDASRAVFYSVWTGCVSEKWVYHAAWSRCYGHWRRGRLYNVTGVRNKCSTSIYNHKAVCVKN